MEQTAGSARGSMGSIQRPMPDAYLVTYLNDHLAGSVMGIELAQRTLSNNKNTEFAPMLRNLVLGLKQEQTRLKQVIASLDAMESTLKKLGGWAMEKVGRLKLNNSLLTYSPLSRVVELEALVIGLEAQVRLWTVLETQRADDPRFEGLDFTRAREDAQSMLAEVKAHHTRAAEIAFAQRKPS